MQIRATYAEMLQNILTENIPLSILKNDAEINDKAFFNMLMMSTLRNLTFIKNDVLPQFVKRKIPQKQNILIYILYLGIAEILFMKTPDYAVINSYVEVAKTKTDKFGANFINAVLRNVVRKRDELLANYRSGTFSCEFLKILKQDYSEQEIAEMEKFFCIEAPLDITVKKDVDVSLIGGVLLSTGSIRLPANTKVTEIYGFDKGVWWVQDAAASLAVKPLGDLTNKTVLDLCAAPGGKTAQLLDAGAKVTAVDISERRLQILKENMIRLKLTDNLKVVCADALEFNTQEKFDIILIDAPCSATGTFRRHPEVVHTKTIGDVKKLSELQEKILNRAKNFLKNGGILAYATCSLSKTEGEKQIANFIKNNAEFSVVKIKHCGCEKMYTKEGFLRILPQHLADFSGIDGFFVAYLQKKI